VSRFTSPTSGTTGWWIAWTPKQDVVSVPNRKHKRPIMDYLGVLYPLSGLLNVLRY